ncbi:hypothetical protein [Ktedonobacter sp. SOSP1-85]|uniref:hypothetical protein n=1 Tax=Ktedonobacter sp. SOSP1-85 TaxID=2778367 RepID=UPI0019164C21|nr:hypothetical protein [Ktedonobacter sp. SOSP1-85]
MMWRRRRMYPPCWKALSTACKARAQWQCEICGVHQQATRRSKRTGKPYIVWLHAAHIKLHDTLNSQPALLCLCPSCHGYYDFLLRLREQGIRLERIKHRREIRKRIASLVSRAA